MSSPVKLLENRIEVIKRNLANSLRDKAAVEANISKLEEELTELNDALAKIKE